MRKERKHYTAEEKVAVVRQESQHSYGALWLLALIYCRLAENDKVFDGVLRPRSGIVPSSVGNTRCFRNGAPRKTWRVQVRTSPSFPGRF
jgi:hypothetical protein